MVFSATVWLLPNSLKILVTHNHHFHRGVGTTCQGSNIIVVRSEPFFTPCLSDISTGEQEKVELSPEAHSREQGGFCAILCSICIQFFILHYSRCLSGWKIMVGLPFVHLQFNRLMFQKDVSGLFRGSFFFTQTIMYPTFYT